MVGVVADDAGALELDEMAAQGGVGTAADALRVGAVEDDVAVVGEGEIEEPTGGAVDGSGEAGGFDGSDGGSIGCW
jgi:hypothetical protein